MVAETDPREFAVDFYKSKGLTDQQARGLVRRLHVESGLNTSAFNPAGGGYGAYGIAQWRGPRLMELTKRPDAHTLKGQLEFSWDELTGSEKKSLEAIKNAKTEDQAYHATTDYYERPGLGGGAGGGGGGKSSLLASLGNYGFTLPSAEGGGGSDPWAAFLNSPDPYAARRSSSLSASAAPPQSSFQTVTTAQPPPSGETPAPDLTPPVAGPQPTMPRIGALSNAYQHALATILSRMAT